jgi:hypothetical protein
MTRPDVIAEMKKFIPVQLYTDRLDIETLTPDQQLEVAEANAIRAQEMTGDTSLPNYVVLTPEGKLVARTGYEPADSNFLRDFLKRSLEKLSAGQKVARTE